MDITSETVLKVAANSDVNKVAGALANMIREHNAGSVRAIGVNAVNQMLKSVAVAENYLRGSGFQVSFNTSFEDVDINGQTITGLRIDATGIKTKTVEKNTNRVTVEV